MVRTALIVIFACLVPLTLAAHGGAGPHGGKLADAGPYSIELIVAGNRIKAFVYNEQTAKPENVTDAKASATILLGKTKETVVLQPDPREKDGNLLSGTTTLEAGPGMRVIVLLRMPNQPSNMARFAL